MCAPLPQFAFHLNGGTDELPQHPDYAPFAFTPPQPTREGSLEYQPDFRKAGAAAWKRVSYGNSNKTMTGSPEAGFTINRDGTTGSVTSTTRDEGPGGMEFGITPDTLATLHTHSDPYSRRPSAIDEQSARKLKTQIYTSTKDGLFLTGPDGKTVQVFKRGDWATRKNPE